MKILPQTIGNQVHSAFNLLENNAGNISCTMHKFCIYYDYQQLLSYLQGPLADFLGEAEGAGAMPALFFSLSSNLGLLQYLGASYFT